MYDCFWFMDEPEIMELLSISDILYLREIRNIYYDQYVV